MTPIGSLTAINDAPTFADHEDSPPSNRRSTSSSNTWSHWRRTTPRWTENALDDIRDRTPSRRSALA